ncbi:UDP-N-acetylmuramate:L-alanyl-gamma-D-glutamyl-meso-diaminopimelate ligase [Flagellatimonas centrodinii]|uniref:UDP-N-acetylmuramate:L-alanyl-gamma-D-glutamyl- meso-diaminopimelate ligase n=1 Tax=Flagellatimonas centrodinii TaxID=2806210 RepID=UPI001FED80F6|nr:UDP-N-acetylmuramate:L-alanyl-gamma-D-glutamyl-meso-diaminopimelate ligase [Flagellatimonas centrodinii]ULQ47082.1 UDP-N-acetylmuramate:L-alanyl-gamma-D-glutamyl-meso-diaminopimelate ligase [Flagellatimonas centrodinii]
MHLHILGICGTFMAGIAALAREAGHTVTGSDANAWPPMSTQLQALGITVRSGYDPAHLDPAPDVVVVGNVVSRGNPAMEWVLDQGLPYVSGPQWLADNVLQGRHVLAVAGTHGKTTTSALLAWLLESAGLQPGFLVGGVPLNFGVSARLGSGDCFVIEADEYDTAFFDKRSKFIHYRPRTCVLNNLEFDHADIFPDLAAIERQFHHLVRTVPGQGALIVNGADPALARVLAQGCWTPVTRFNVPDGWQAEAAPGGFSLAIDGVAQGPVSSPLPGPHNRANTLAAFAAARALGVELPALRQGLATFRNVRRRLELRGEVAGVQVYDDFAHHPTAIEVTIAALREQGSGRVLAVLEPRSNSMRIGSHARQLAAALREADHCYVLARPDLQWDAQATLVGLVPPLTLGASVPELVSALQADTRPGDRVLVMSNGDFDSIHDKLLASLATP